MKLIGYTMLFFVVNYFAIKLGRVSGYKDKKASDDLKKGVLIFLAGIINGFLFFY